MKILVLGGAGFLGEHVIAGLLKENHQIRVFDRTLTSFEDNVESITANFDDSMKLSEALIGIDLVIHLISTSVPSSSNSDPVSDINGNLVNTVHLLELMKKNDVKRIIYYSSGGTIYGRPQVDIITEKHQTSPCCSYGIVKLSIEKYLNMYAELYGFSVCVLRPSNPYGPGQKKIGVQGVIGTCISHAFNGTIFNVWGDGTVIRDYIFVSDMVDATICAVNNVTEGVFNISSAQGHSINHVIKIVEKYTQKKVSVEYRERRKFDIAKVILDNQKAIEYLGWEPKVSLDEGISITAKSFQLR
jgi:UDP-glucose 4-epimerase